MQQGRITGHSSSAGAIICHLPSMEILMVNQCFPDGDSWSFPKGHFEPAIDYNMIQTAYREVKEETGFLPDQFIGRPYPLPPYHRESHGGVKEIKHISLFFMTTTQRYGNYEDFNPEVENICKLEWTPPHKVNDLLISDQDKIVYSTHMIGVLTLYQGKR